MTEAEWLTCSDPVAMVRSLQGRGGERKPRLWACAFFRWRYSDVGMLMRAVEAAEQWAERGEPNKQSDLSCFLVCDRATWQAAERTAKCVAKWAESAEKKLAETFQLQTLRCVFGNPFRRVSIHPGWRSGDAVAVTEGIYFDRAFDRLPLLADALEEAGCDNQEILDHCRCNGEHVRGCWVVDLLLGKS